MDRHRAGHGIDPWPFPQSLPALTSVRFVLALGVVLFHLQLQWPWPTLQATGLIERARLGVDVFFILSGFVLTHAYRGAIADRALDYRRFVVARLARIYPAHLAVLGFVLVMVGGASLVGAEFDRELYNPAGLLLTLLLVQAWGPELITAEWNGPSWSLSAEWFAYLIFPAYAWLGRALGSRPWSLLAIASASFLALDGLYQRAFGDIVVHAEANMGVLRIAPEFLYGVALYRLGERLQASRNVTVIAAASTAAVLLILMHASADDRLIVAAAGPLVLSLALLSKAGADAPLRHPWLLAAGEASYALYLVHFPLLIAWKGVRSALTDEPSTYVLAGWEVAGLIALSLMVALALHFGIEAPARRWIRRWADAHLPARSRAVMPAGSQPPDV